MKICFFLIFYIFFNICSVYAQETKIDNVIAVVNNQVILNSDVEKFLFLIKHESMDLPRAIDKTFLREKVIQKLILETLLLDSANSMNIQVTDEQVNNTIKDISFQKNITIKQLKNNILFHDVNTLFTYNDYFENIKKQLKIQILQNYELQKRINISEKEISNLLYKRLIKNNKNNDINISYILLPFSEKTSKQIIRNKKILAENIIKKIHNGYHFISLYNRCIQHKTFFSVKTIPLIHFLDLQKMFSHTLNIVKKGDIMGPFLEKKGLYILRINDIKNKQEKRTKEFHIQHCFIKFSPIMNNYQAKKNIFKIYKNLKNGKYDFDYSVKHFSDDFYLHDKKGDLGWIPYEEFNRDFQKILINLKDNSISMPIRSNIGWHIIKLLHKRSIDQYFQIERNKIYHFLFNQKIVLEKNKWIHELKKLSYIHLLKP